MPVGNSRQMCTRQRTASLKSFSLGNMQDKACLVLDLRELRPRHQVTAQGVPGQDAKQLVRLVAGKSQPASGPKSQRTRRRGRWWITQADQEAENNKPVPQGQQRALTRWEGRRQHSDSSAAWTFRRAQQQLCGYGNCM